MIRAETPTSTQVVNAMALLGCQGEWPLVPTAGEPTELCGVRTIGRTIGAYHIFGRVSLLRSSDELPAYQVLPEPAYFKLLVDQWRAERGATSSITEMVMCRSHLRIIGMGENAIPLILHEMEREGDEPDMWFVALQILTGEDPVTDEIRGDFKAMADRWLEWAATAGYAR